MIIKVKDSDVEYLKTLCRCFNNFTAYVHEGVHITVDPYASAEVHEAAESLVKFRDQCIFPEFFEMLNDIREQIKEPVPDTDDPINKFFEMFNFACCTCSNEPVTAYDLNQRCGDAPVEGFFEAWDSMVRAIKDRDHEAVLYLGYRLHSLINTMDMSIYDYKHGTWIDDYINWYLEEVK